jgi:ElaB/YqjD/DUF883 family membrane-anchored ribosome-binding protein
MQATNPGAGAETRARLAADLAESKSRLASDFKTLLTDAEALLRATGSYGGEGLAQARVKFDEQLAQLKEKLASTQSYTMEKCKDAAAATDEYVRSSPWQSVGIAAAIGLVAGVLFGRSGSADKNQSND